MTTMPDQADNPDEIRRDLASNRRALERLFDGLTDDDLREPGMTGHWSGKDTLAHIGRWDAFVAHAIELYLADGTLLEGGVAKVIDRLLEINDEWAAEDRDLSLEAARARFVDEHAAARRAVDRIGPDQWDAETIRWVRALAIHYEEHLETTGAWLRTRVDRNRPGA